MNEIYLDNSATTPICKEALEEYIRISESNYGNASSLHLRGQEAEKAVNLARERIKTSLGVRDGRVIFTSGGTESNNLAILGRAYSKERYRGGRIITSRGEHASVTLPLHRLKEEGFDVVEVPTVGGKLDLEFLENALTEKTFLVTVMAVNNETGAVYDLKSVGKLVKKKCPDCLFHCDATQSYMKIPMPVKAWGIDAITLSSHKIEGPKGVGALWISPKVEKEKGLSPRELGGGQENGMRSGTLNVPGIAAFGAAVEKCKQDFTERTEKLRYLREMTVEGMIPEIQICEPENPSPHILTLTLPQIKSEVMLHFLSGKNIYVSSGSACSSHGGIHESPLLAFGYSPKEVDCSIRVSFGSQSKESDVGELISALQEGCAKLQRIR